MMPKSGIELGNLMARVTHVSKEKREANRNKRKQFLITYMLN